ncbi:MAG: ATP-binding cassette domain-containing protein [Lachnospirales bacterium]
MLKNKCEEKDFFVTKHIYKRRNNFILDINNFGIYKNKVNVILGENGSGKSTLLNEILDNGNILMEFKKILLTQNSYTFNRTCLKNIEMVLKWNNSDKTPIDFLKLVDLESKSNEIGKNLSGGEKKRLAFAMAFATNADLILLDEPFANVDKKNQEKLINSISNIKDEKTIVLVSHRSDICKEIGDYFMEMEYGKIIKTGSCNFFM